MAADPNTLYLSRATRASLNNELNQFEHEKPAEKRIRRDRVAALFAREGKLHHPVAQRTLEGLTMVIMREETEMHNAKAAYRGG